MRFLLFFLLIAFSSKAAGPLALPTLAIPASPFFKTQTVFVAVTALDDTGVESDFSLEKELTATNNTFAITWDNETNALGFNVYWGTNSSLYRSVAFAPTNSANVFVSSSLVVTTYYYFFAQSSTNVAGPFSDATTNPFARYTNCGMGISGSPYTRTRLLITTNALP